MSAALELMAPAAPQLSARIGATGAGRPFTTTWGAATLSRLAATLVLVRDMPSGANTRSRRNSSQLRPETSATTSPAATYITLLYA